MAKKEHKPAKSGNQVYAFAVPTVVAGQPLLVFALSAERSEFSDDAALVSLFAESSVLRGLIAHLVGFLRLI